VSENSVQSCSWEKGCGARRDEGAYPPGVWDQGATKPGGLFPDNPPGGGSFVRGLRWLGRYSPLRGCSVGQSGSDLRRLGRSQNPAPQDFTELSDTLLDRVSALAGRMLLRPGTGALRWLRPCRDCPLPIRPERGR
jgi:hypothetical protein